MLQNLFWKVWHTFFPCIYHQKVFLVKTVFMRAEILPKHLWSQGCYLCRLNSILNFGEFDDLDTDYWLFNCWLLIICYWLLLADYWLFIADYYCATCQNFIRVFFLQKKVTSLWYSKKNYLQYSNSFIKIQIRYPHTS